MITLTARLVAIGLSLSALPVHVLTNSVSQCHLDDTASSGDGLVCADDILGDFDVVKFTANATSPTKPGSTTGGGWLDPKICSGEYCVYANKEVAHGRGLALITTVQNLQKIRRIQDRLADEGVNHAAKTPAQVGVQAAGEEGAGLSMVARESLKRGEKLMAWGPVLMIRKTFFEDVPAAKQETLLAAAFQLLPDATRRTFRDMMRVADAGESRALKEVVLRHAFESDVGWPANGRQNELHYAVYPEAAVLRHDCRPNVAYYIDGHHVHHAVVARRVQPGEELTVSRVVDPVQTRLERQRILKRWKGGECGCPLCSQAKDSEQLKESDKRVKEIRRIKAKLSDYESRGVTTEIIARFVKLYKEERLEVSLAEAYELAALNYNYLGFAKEAAKYATLAAQAGSIEAGVGSNNVIAMRIMAKDPVGHYSYKMKAKKLGI